jgi:hypothetical protein
MLPLRRGATSNCIIEGRGVAAVAALATPFALPVAADFALDAQ